jgi:hypothetical protein
MTQDAQMAYRRSYRRRNSRRRRNRPSRLRNIKRRTGAKSQSRQIASLARSVSQLKKEATQYAQWTMPLEGADGSYGVTLTNGQFYVNSLMRPQGWSPIFQTTANVGGADGGTVALGPNKMKVMSFDIQLLFSPADSRIALTPRIVNLWVIKFRKETASDTLNATQNFSTAGVNANAAELTSPLFYRTTSDGGLPTLIKLNPAAFDIRAYRQFTVANILEETSVIDENTALTNTQNALKRVRIRVPCGNELKPGKGTVRQMTEQEIMPLDRYYVLVHVGGWGGPGVDGDNKLRMDSNIFVNSRVYV